MSHVNVVRAWKDEEYRLSLSDAERARLPENPAGLLDQTETELEQAVGGYFPVVRFSWGGCTSAVDACPSWFCTIVVGL
jgi:mersacidin/lichenicidin family type 2 lantibiotic